MSSPRRYGHAVVIGGSMAGLFAARVLSKHFKSVTLFDKDTYVSSPACADVPQGRHVAVLMNQGHDFAAEYFPGIIEEMTESGGNSRRWRNFSWLHSGGWRPRLPQELPLLQSSRPFMEWHFRRRIFKLHNVTVYDQTLVRSLLTGDEGRRVTGVVVESVGGSFEEVHADLVLDVSGADSRSEQWLADLGYQPPPRLETDTNAAVVSRLYRRPPGFPKDVSWLALYPGVPEQKRAGFLFEVENDTFIVSLSGHLGDHCPLDHEGFMAFAKSLPRPDIHDWIKDAVPLTEPTRYKVSSSLWRRYEQLKRFPAGYAVMGEAYCSFNPVFGQGMSVAALSARVLDVALTIHPGDDLENFSPRFFQLQAATLRVPWLLTTSWDLRYRVTHRSRSLGLKLLNHYLGQVMQLAAVNPAVNRELSKVLFMHTGLSPLFKPAMMVRTLLHGLKTLGRPQQNSLELSEANSTGDSLSPPGVGVGG